MSQHVILEQSASRFKAGQGCIYSPKRTGSCELQRSSTDLARAPDLLENMAAQRARIQQVWQITGGNLKRKQTWVAETKELDGNTFVKIDKWNRPFVSFVTGKALQLQAGREAHHLSIPAFGKLLDARKDACAELYQATVREAAAAAGDPEPQARQPREADCYLTGRVVTMRLPAVEFEGDTADAIEMRALWSISAPEMWVELTEANMDYLRVYLKKGLQDHTGSEPQRRRRKKLQNALGDKHAKSPKKKKSRSSRRRMNASPEEHEPAPLPPPPVASAECDEEHETTSSDKSDE